MALGRKILIFIKESIFVQDTSGSQTNCVDALEAKNIGFLAGNYTLLVTEEGMLAAVGTQNIDFLAGKCIFLQGTSGGQTNCVDASEAKTLIFLQENVHF